MAQKSVLVVDDDPICRALLVKVLRARNINVHEAENGFVARKVFSALIGKIDLIVSDIQMPVLNGVDLLKQIRIDSDVPFVVITGLTDLLESRQAHELGANDFITKPVEKDALQKIFNLLDMGLDPEALQKKPDIVWTEKDFRQIHIDDFLSSSKLQSDIYIRLSDTKFVKVARKDETIPIARLKFYREKKVDFLYVRAPDFSNYVQFTADLTSQVLQNKTLADGAKVKLFRNTAKIMVEQCFIAEIEKPVLIAAQQVIEDALDFAANDAAILDQLAQLQAHSDQLYGHSLAVALYSCALAKEHGWGSSTTLLKLSLGALLHDIGKKEIAPEILSKPRKLLSIEEIKIVESHAAKGRDILVQIQGLPEEVAFIALHHHETKIGTGYPLRLRGEQINPLARLVHVVDKFCSLIFPANEAEKLGTHEALGKMKQYYSEELDYPFLLRLMTICKYTDVQKKTQKPA